MMTDIKVGDKVRVREDAPEMYLRTVSTKFLGAECRVFEIIDGNAAIASGRDYIAIPTKYLVKVEEEKKDAKFKKGDKVKVNLPRSKRHNRIGTVVLAYASGNAVDFGDGDGLVYCDCGCLEPYTESCVDRINFAKRRGMQQAAHKAIVDEFYDKPFDWEQYTADLAKEVAIVYAKQKRDVRLAVRAAKSVVEELKKK